MIRFLFSLIVLVNFPSLVRGSMKIVHYNIRELDSIKMEQGLTHVQVKSATEILKSLKPDILSINEMQYDIVDVPNKNFKSKGANLEKFLRWIDPTLIYTWFIPANTGMASIPLSDDSYITDTNHPKVLELADPINFGIFPAQYSTGGAFKFEVLDVKEWGKIVWKEFNTELKLNKYRDHNDNKLPEEMELFDKSFSDVTVKINGKPVHVILLHAVPAFDFGNKKSVNLYRNGQQLEFLKWYLTGKTELNISPEFPVKPLKEGETFIAVGDWNSDIRDPKKEGAEVLRELGRQFQYAFQNQTTYETFGFRSNLKVSQLDYILLSKDIKINSAGVYRPQSLIKELGCELDSPKAGPLKVLVTYKNVSGKNCYKEVSPEYYNAKKASDHFPIWADIEI